MAEIRVLLIEDNRLLREGATAILNEQEDIKAVAASGANGDALKKARVLKPQVVLLGIGLKSQSTLTVVRKVRKEFPRTEVVVMDLVPVHTDVVQFVKEGVSGFVLKDATLDDFLHTIRTVAKGVKVLPPPLTGSLFSQIVEHALQVGDPAEMLNSVTMSKREQEIIELIAQGQGNKEIARVLGISIPTVKSHVHNILEKLALDSRLELASREHAKSRNKRRS